jgi:ABC-2 type transport system ATP-binding protein
MKAISTHDLTRVFGNLTAVDHISFNTEEGEIFGLLGLNGAGKTTTILMLATLLNPTSGTATVCGYDVVKKRNSVRRCIGVVFEEQAVDIYLTGRQNLDLSVMMYNVPKKIREERVTNALNAIGLADFAHVRVKDYSGGMLRRLEIARAMLTYPRVLFLDEPTTGVDVQTRRYLWDYLRRVNRELGMTIFLATSYLEEADYLCHRVALMDQGKLIVAGTPEELKASIGKNLISLQLATGREADFIKLLQGQEYVENIEERDGSLALRMKNGRVGIPDIVRLARGNGFTISSISSHKPSLNDVLLHYTGKKVEG